MQNATKQSLSNETHLQINK